MLLDRFYDRDLSDRSLAQTYLEIVYAGAEHGVVFPSELVLQAKAVVTAASQTLVLAPDFRFADEIRPVAARELAKKATPQATMDRAWGELVDWILLGESGTVILAPTTAEADEAEFRREAVRAVADVWTDDVDALLRELQADVPEYTSTKYRQEHPEHPALLETGVGLLRILATDIVRLEARGTLDRESKPTSLTDVDGNGDVPTELFSDGILDVLTAVQDDTEQYIPAEFWDANHQSRATSISALPALRLFLVRLNQSIDASQVVARLPEETAATQDGPDD